MFLQYSIYTSPLTPGAANRNPERFLFFQFYSLGVCDISGLGGAGVHHSISTSLLTPDAERRNP